jgi:hypothetical protein
MLIRSKSFGKGMMEHTYGQKKKIALIVEPAGNLLTSHITTAAYKEIRVDSKSVGFKN